MQLQEQLMKLLKSLGVITTREYVEALQDIDSLRPGITRRPTLSTNEKISFRTLPSYWSIQCRTFVFMSMQIHYYYWRPMGDQYASSETHRRPIGDHTFLLETHWSPWASDMRHGTNLSEL